MTHVTRISFNSARWQRPSGEGRKIESSETHSHQFGYGYEDWLFRDEWLVDGWRYGFIHGMFKGRKQRIAEGKPIDLLLFTITPQRERHYIAQIREVEWLDDQQAADALQVYKDRGWYDQMKRDIAAVGGDSDQLDTVESAAAVLDIRFRLANVTRFDPPIAAQLDDPIVRLNRYQLHKLTDLPTVANGTKAGPAGSTDLPESKRYMVPAMAARECTPEHIRMQARLMEELKREYPGIDPIRESGYVDVMLPMPDQIILFEIKTDLSPKSVIRRALGQLLEYAFYTDHMHGLPIHLVIVGRKPPTNADNCYIQCLKSRFNLPISYRVVVMD